MFDKPDSITAAVRINAGNCENSSLHRAIYYSGSNLTGGGRVDLWVPVVGNQLITDTDTSDIVFGNGWVDVVEAINRKMNVPEYFTYLLSDLVELHVAGDAKAYSSNIHFKEPPLDPKDPSYHIYKSIKEDLPQLSLSSAMDRRNPYSYSPEAAKYKYIPLGDRYIDIPEFNNIYSEKESHTYKIKVVYHGGPRSLRLFNPKMLTNIGYHLSGDKKNDNQEQIQFINEHLPAIRDVAKSGKEIDATTATAGLLAKRNTYNISIIDSDKFDHSSYCAEFGLAYNPREHTIEYNPKKIKARITYYTKGRGNKEVKTKLEELQLSKDKLWSIMHIVSGSLGNELFESVFIEKEGWNTKKLSQGQMEHLLFYENQTSLSDHVKGISSNVHHQDLYGITFYCDKRKITSRYLKNKKIFQLMKDVYKKIHKVTLGQMFYYENKILGRNILSNNYMGVWWVYKSIEANKIVKLDVEQFHKDFAKSYSDYLLVAEEKRKKKELIQKRKTDRANAILAAAVKVANESKEVKQNVS